MASIAPKTVRSQSARSSVIVNIKKGMLAEIMDDGVDGKAAAPASTKCPCGSGGEYDACCGLLHDGKGGDSATPEMIVRARFSAYVKNLPKYVVSSTHPESKDMKRKDDPAEALEQLETDAASTMKTVNFTKIKKIKVTDGKEKDEQFVSYEVAYKGAGKKNRSGAKTLQETRREVDVLRRVAAEQQQYQDGGANLEGVGGIPIVY